MTKTERSIDFIKERINAFGILGPGLIGGSIAKDLHSNFPEQPLYAIGEHTEDTKAAIKAGVIRDLVSFDDIPKHVNLIIIATPLSIITSTAKKIAQQQYRGNEKRYVLDVGSTKKDISDEFEALTTDRVEFVPTHPMSGTEFSGFVHARKNLFRNQAWVICPHETSTEEGVRVAHELVTAIGARPLEMDAESHDRRASLVSHTVITLSNLLFDFISQRDPEALEMAGSGFISTTRHASGNPVLYESIIANNGPAIQANVDAFVEYLQKQNVAHLGIDFFKANKDRRDQLVHRRGGTAT